MANNVYCIIDGVERFIEPSILNIPTNKDRVPSITPVRQNIRYSIPSISIYCEKD